LGALLLFVDELRVRDGDFFILTDDI
jgi:hypothetical protein